MIRPILHALAGTALLATAGLALAQGSGLTAAIAAGSVGEQADGYLGTAKPVSSEIKAQVDALNIKRRAAYTDAAAQHGVALRDWAVTVGCQTLKRVKPGEVYRLPDGVWRTRGADPIALPAVCG